MMIPRRKPSLEVTIDHEQQEQAIRRRKRLSLEIDQVLAEVQNLCFDDDQQQQEFKNTNRRVVEISEESSSEEEE